MKYKIDYSEELTFNIDFSDDKTKIDGQGFEYDLSKISQNKYHILHKGSSYDIEIQSFNRSDKTISLLINSVSYSFKVNDKLDVMLQDMGMSVLDADTLDDVKAPMPGLVLDIFVSPGDAIKKGDSLLILEAMKMENIIKSSGNGTVKAINVSKQDAVEKNQVLIEVE